MQLRAQRTKLVGHILRKLRALRISAPPATLPNLFIRRGRRSTPWRNIRDVRDEREKQLLQRLPEVMSEKRRAPSLGGNNWKKTKTEKEKKWYAVKSGKEPGVYETWDECQEQTTGYHGAVYKSFTHKEDAEAFVAGRKVPDRGGKPKPMRYYAVARANYTGIFNDWSEAQGSLKEAKLPKYKRFDTLPEAIAFMEEWADEETLERVREEYGEVLEPEPTDDEVNLEPGLVHIYTDGSSLGNGKKGSMAGVGVFFGKNDPRNISERLEGDVQTNQRAELTAILRALEGVPVTKPVQILTDSMYSINCAQKWSRGWEKKGWKTTEGHDVKNRDLIQAIRKRIVERDAAKAKTVLTWVKGHANTAGNIEADRLAVAGAYRAPKEVSKPAKGRTKLKTEMEESFDDGLDELLGLEPDRAAVAGAYRASKEVPKTAKGRTKLKTETGTEMQDSFSDAYDEFFAIESADEKDLGTKRRRR